MSRRLDLGIASYGNSEKLLVTLDSIIKHTVSDWRCFIVDNPGPDPETRTVIRGAANRDHRFIPVYLDSNIGYAGAVNTIIDCCVSDTPYIVYMDNDVEIHTPGWDLALMKILDDYDECAQVFPGYGHYGFFNGRYHECLWNAGYFWMARKTALVGLLNKEYPHRGSGFVPSKNNWPMDTNLGHHEEVDLIIRFRMAGFTIGCNPDVHVTHHETATSSPESARRIHMGVVRWMNKYNRYFCGDVLKYPNPDPDSKEGYDPRSLRYTDWHPMALYLERMTLHYFPDWNANPRTVNVPGVGEMDVIEVLKPKGCYVGRAI